MPDLQSVWFGLLAVLLGGYAVLDGFDLGVGMLHLFLAKDDHQRRTLMQAIGPVWDGNEVWLLAGTGALFAAFPNAYATIFSGFYVPVMLVLSGLIFRAVSLEFRSKEEGRTWRSLWDIGFALGSFLPALLFGVALGNVLRGLPLSADGEYAGGFVTLLHPFALAVWLLAVAMFVMQGAAWLVLKTGGELAARARRAAFGGWASFVVLWTAALSLSSHAAPRLWQVYAAPAAWIAPLLFHFALISFPFSLRWGSVPPFAFSSAAVLGGTGIVAQSLYPVLVPARGGTDLTIYNACSSPGTLRAMLVIALAGMPLVLAYTVFIYRSFRGPVVVSAEGY